MKGGSRHIQDPIHGTMEFDGLSRVVVDLLRTPEVSRLRHVKQLGLAPFVFPGAEHTRFQHALGASYVASRFASTLARNSRHGLPPSLLPTEDVVRDVAVATLLHDLGHGPFSHVWEKHVIGEDFDRNAWAGALGIDNPGLDLDRASWHELATIGLVLWPEGELHALLEQQEAGFAQRICMVLRGRGWPPYLSDIVSGDIDSDRLDYLQRDALMAGVAYGRIDSLRIEASASIEVDPEDGRLVLVFDGRRGGNAIEQFLIGRRAMYRSVYQHKTVRSGELLLGGILSDCARLDGSVVREVARDSSVVAVLGGHAVDPPTLLRLNDDAVWMFVRRIARSQLVASVDPSLQDLARRFLDRDWPRLVAVGRRVEEFMARPDARARLQHAVSKVVLSAGPSHVIHDICALPPLLGSQPSRVYLRDAAGITLLRHTTLLRDPGDEVEHRLYVPREAVASVRQLLER